MREPCAPSLRRGRAPMGIPPGVARGRDAGAIIANREGTATGPDPAANVGQQCAAVGANIRTGRDRHASARRRTASGVLWRGAIGDMAAAIARVREHVPCRGWVIPNRRERVVARRLRLSGPGRPPPPSRPPPRAPGVHVPPALRRDARVNSRIPFASPCPGGPGARCRRIDRVPRGAPGGRMHLALAPGAWLASMGRERWGAAGDGGQQSQPEQSRHEQTRKDLAWTRRAFPPD